MTQNGVMDHHPLIDAFGLNKKLIMVGVKMREHAEQLNNNN